MSVSLSTIEDKADAIHQLTSVKIDAPVHCPRYAARMVENVKVETSPFWLQDRLLSVLDAISDEFETRLSPKPVWKSTKVPADALARMMRQIRPVEMQVETVESTYKLGQNKPDAARLGAAVNVETSPVGQDTVRLAAAMREAEP